jgi:hypothetical protein
MSLINSKREKGQRQATACSKQQGFFSVLNDLWIFYAGFGSHLQILVVSRASQ